MILLKTKDGKIAQYSGESFVPVEAFAQGNSPAEAVVAYLKDHCGLHFCEIARLLNRDQRGIWGTYHRAKRKVPENVPLPDSSAYMVPVSRLFNRSCSILEHVVMFLKDDRQVGVSTICRLLNKKPSTVWTAYQRGRRKTR